MLIQFEFQNFTSFRDETTLDLSAVTEKFFQFHIVQVGKEKLLPIAIIYGANASGKSNVLKAFSYMKRMVVSSFLNNRFGTDGEKISFHPPVPFLLDKESRDIPSSFEVYFTAKQGKETFVFNYGFTADKEGIQEEWLNREKIGDKNEGMQEVFYRNGESFEIDEKICEKKILIVELLKKETLVVSVGAILNIDCLKIVEDWFVSCKVVDFGDPLETNKGERLLPSGFVEDKNVREQVVQYFSTFDGSIVDFEVKQNEGEDTFALYSVHRERDTGERVPFDFDLESAGTQKMFGMFPILEQVIKEGGVLFADELNAKLHPLLLRHILQMFLNPELNPNHAQIILTSHDAWLLSSGLFRRDEIWFTEKESDGATVLYALDEFEEEETPRKRDLQEDYLVGRYGAIPRFGKWYHFVESSEVAKDE